MIKLTKEELEDIEQIQSRYNTAGTKLVSIRLALCQNEQERVHLQNKMDQLDRELQAISRDEREWITVVEEQYGPGVLNPQTGEFTPD